MNREPARVLSAELREILDHASRAPSGHNAQPWTVRLLEPGRLVVGTAAERWLPAIDPTNRELFLSIGAFLENLVVTARYRGFDIDSRPVGTGANHTDLLDVRLLRARPIDFPLEKIRLRRTFRGHHLPQELKSTDLQRLSAPLGDRLVFIPRASPAGKYLELRTIEANRVQVDRDAAQEELSRWIRWSNEDVRRSRDGLTPQTLEITGLAGWYLRHFMTPRAVMKKSFRDQSVGVVRKQLKSYGGWLIVTSSDSSVGSLLETGRAFQRMFLAIRERMIVIHPMSQILEESPFREEVAKELGVTGTVQFVLRAGYVTHYPDPVSLRRPVEWFVSS